MCGWGYTRQWGGGGGYCGKNERSGGEVSCCCARGGGLPNGLGFAGCVADAARRLRECVVRGGRKKMAMVSSSGVFLVAVRPLWSKRRLSGVVVGRRLRCAGCSTCTHSKGSKPSARDALGEGAPMYTVKLVADEAVVEKYHFYRRDAGRSIPCRRIHWRQSSSPSVPFSRTSGDGKKAGNGWGGGSRGERVSLSSLTKSHVSFRNVGAAQLTVDHSNGFAVACVHSCIHRTFSAPP